MKSKESEIQFFLLAIAYAFIAEGVNFKLAIGMILLFIATVNAIKD